MINNWPDLVKHLQLNEAHPDATAVLRLQTWYQNHISMQLWDDKDPVSLERLKQCIESYFGFLRTSAGAAPWVPQPDFDSRNSLQEASARGYDIWLRDTLEQNVEAIAHLDDVTPVRTQTALYFAALYGHPEVVRLLLESGVSPEIPTRLGQTAMHAALIMMPGFSTEIKINKEAIFRLLSQTPDLLLKTDSSGDTVAHYMVLYDHPGLLQDLAGSEYVKLLTRLNNAGHNPLHTAYLNRRDACIRILENQDALTVQTDSRGRPMSWYANEKTLFGHTGLEDPISMSVDPSYGTKPGQMLSS